jgi:hypothetical protein
MRRGVGAAAAVALFVATAVVLVIGTTNGPAWADCPPDPVDETGICLSDTVPGTPGTTDPGNPGNTGGTDPADQLAPVRRTASASTTTASSGTARTTATPFRSTPSRSPTAHFGETTTRPKGQMWSCDPTVSVPENTWYVPDGQAVINPAQVAQQLLERAPFETREREDRAAA